jgi:branched-chain amino acid transport system substrate-binding protein
MQVRIGFLMPRSTDYPAMGFDMLDGLRAHLELLGIDDLKLFTENIGFGEDHALTYARAEKLLLQEDVQVLIAYSSIQNAEPLFAMAKSSGRLFVFLDAGMQLSTEDKVQGAWFISLQGMQACNKLGKIAGAGARKALMATSFFDAGYSGLLNSSRGLEEAGGSMCAHFVSRHKISEFSIEEYLQLLGSSGAEAVVANFSIYLSELFLKSLKEAGGRSVSLPVYCSPFMGEEELLSKCEFPGGDLQIIVPWSQRIENEAQQLFVKTIKDKKDKTANLFHLLGWEAAQVIVQAINKGQDSLTDFSFESPRGKVTFHPKTKTTYAPLYKGKITSDNALKCQLQINEVIEVAAQEHEAVYSEKQEGIYSGWKNNYFCAS